jgi:formylglycine-generating enzyme required for sulfatase activity
MKTRALSAMMCVMAVVNLASGDVIRGIDIDFVTIGHPGNPGDTRPEAYPYGSGAVSYNYRIGKYEITAAQWQTIDSAAGIGDSGGWSGDQPVAWISCYDATQFCNYLTSGDKNLGAYQIGTDAHIVVDRASAISTYGTIYVLPTEDEWYKAAYYKPDGSGYSTYANGEEDILISPPHDGWNYYGGAVYAPWDVGTGTQEQNGTFDMMGNVYEWNEKVFPEITPCSGFRGGSYAIEYYHHVGFPETHSLSSSDFSGGIQSWREEHYVGFRVASVPEPATLLLLGLGSLALLRRRKVV